MSKYKKSSEFARSLTTTKLDCGLTLRELTNYQDITLWWFAHFDFIDFLMSIPEVGTDYNPKGLRFQTQLSKLPLLFPAGLNLGFDLSRKILVKTALSIYGKNKQKRKQEASARKILFTAQDLMWREVRDYKTGKISKSDAFFDSLIKILRDRENFYLVGTYPFVKYVYPLRSAIQCSKILLDKLKNWDIPHRPFNLYWMADVWKKEYNASRYFLKMWKTLASDKKFQQLCVFNGRDVLDLLSRKIRFYFLVLFPYATKRIEMSKRMLDKEQPDLILLINEYGIFERSLLIAGKNKGIATLAVQHGNIMASHPGYMYAADEISKTGEVKSPYCPVPDKTAVTGAYFKRLLSEVSSYPKESIIVTGQSRYDVLDTLQKRLNRESILEEYGIDSDKRIVLWTTQCIGFSESENVMNFRAAQAAIAELDECILVIKQHPRENEGHTEIIRRELRIGDGKVVLVSKTADTLSLIWACDVMITHWSTTALEALALDRDLIIMNLGGGPDKVDYVKDRVALGVHRAEELTPAIKKLLNNDVDLAEKRKEYIEQHLYKIDGKATLRVVNLITQMLGTQCRKEK